MATVGPVGIVGLGLLGSAVAGRLRAAGRDVVGHDVVPERNRALVAIGGRAVASAAAVAEAADPVCVVLPSLAAVEEGTAGQAMVLKRVANLLVALNSAAAAEALAMVERAGLDVPLALDVLRSSAATSRMLEVRGPLIVKRDFPPQMKLDLFMKDLHLIQEAAGAVGAAVPLTDVAERLYAAAQAAGHGGEDLAVVVTALARR